MPKVSYSDGTSQLSINDAEQRNYYNNLETAKYCLIKIQKYF